MHALQQLYALPASMDKSSASSDGTQGATQPTSDDMANPHPSTQVPSTDPTTITNITAGATSSSNQASKPSSTTNSLNQSPVASRDVSRDSSPVRKPRRTTSTQALGSASQSRRNSQHDLSPTRQRSSFSAEPSSATLAGIPKPFSSGTFPVLRPAGRETHIQAPTPRSPAFQELKESHRWPVSPRLRSPPPLLARPLTLAARRNELDPPSINVQRPSPTSLPPESLQVTPETDSDDSHMQSGIRTPVRGALETVQEVSQNNSPAHAADASLVEHVKEKLAPPESQSDGALSDNGRVPKSKGAVAPGQVTNSEVGGSRNESRRPSSVPPPPSLVSRQSSIISTKQAKSKPEGSTQNMTVETETISVPQMVLSTGTKSEGGTGTLKTKPSSETIKPKKEKKRPARKQPQVNSGTVSSKADIFEAKIASAVDEANTSDSEETFVYDSNPPDTTERSTRRFHSRTPSATSMASQADRSNLRSIYGIMEGGSHGHGPVPKKSMKFVNTFGGNASDSLAPGDEDGKGTGRSTGGSARGTFRHHHHIGRWGRQPGNGHASIFDNESPFPNVAQSKIAGTGARNLSGPTSPRNYQSARGHFNTKRSTMQMSSGYDMDDTTGADDERTPLLESGRSLRGNRIRRGPHNLRQAESQTYTRRSSYLNRFAACLVLTMMFLLVITGAIGFMFATSQPMNGIEIVSIGNVVTSEQVLMYDLTIKAHNPNIVVVTIDHANLEIFAKSKFADPDTKHGKHRDKNTLHARDDPANEPPVGPGDGHDDDSDNRPNILLGRVSVFDSPLTFEGSLFHQGSSTSTGQMQLPNPGNNTVDGTDRWSSIYQHEFDLIVKGVVKYSLPLSAHVRTATVAGRTLVKPNSANNPSPNPNTTTPINE